jgi:hypothetical protein
MGTMLANLVAMLSQATDQLMEFLRTFYKAFPEYETVDVCRFVHPGAHLMAARRPIWAARAMLDNIFPTSV